MLRVENLQAAYGESQVLFGVDLHVDAGEVVTLLGRNGMGKSTTIHSIFGLIKPTQGCIKVDGRDLTGAQPHQVAEAGLGLVPEGRQVFPTLTVTENLIATARAPGKGSSKWTLATVFELFPRLKERRRHKGDQLSGGEQQMLAIGRALMTNPRLMVLDEATEGLAPLIRQDIWACLRRLKAEGEAILVIDKNVDALSALADRHTVLERGKVVWSGSTGQFLAEPDIKDRFLNV